VAALIVVIIRRIARVKKIVVDVVAKGMKKSNKPEESEAEQGGTTKP
jgi:hypothetical protein